MIKKYKQIVRFFFLCLLTTLFSSLSIWLVAAQEKLISKSSNEIGNCEECCQKCRKNFYSDCLLSPAMIDNFGILNHETEMARLDTSVYTILSAPEFDAYVVIYGGKINRYGEIAERLNRIKIYLLNIKKLDPTRIFFITGGFREKLEFELWLSPVKNSYPPLSPTVDAEKVVFKEKIKPLINSY